MFDFQPAADRFGSVAGAVTADDLVRPTPCSGWTVRDLLEHAAAGPRFFCAIARKDLSSLQSLEIDPGGDWKIALAADLEDLVAAWRDPAAWAGETTVDELTFPNDQWARIGYDEAVLHGWDLAVATGHAYEPGTEELDVIEPFIEETASGPAVEGLWGPSVDTGDGASRFEQILGLSGRDPDWTPGR